MTDPLSLIPVRGSEISIGKPLRCAVYDWHGKLLLAANSIVQTKSQLEGLVANGFFHNVKWDESLTSARLTAPVMARRGTPSSDRQSIATNEETTNNRESTVDMDAIRWNIGEALYLQLLDRSTVRYTVKLIGYIKGHSVLTTGPTLDGKFELVRDGQMFVVRAFVGTNAYAFTAAAVKSIHSPHPYLHLAYPKTVRTTAVRQGARAQVKLIASVSLGDNEQPGTALLNDLSIGGASGFIEEPMGKKGDVGRIKFKVHIAGHDHFLDMKIILRSTQVSQQGEGVLHGFEFVDLQPQEKVVLSAVVNQTLIEMG
jgi:hypothetical protein